MNNIKNNKKLNAIFFLLGLVGIFSLNVFAAAPANDNFADSEQLTGIRLSVTRSNVEATKETGEPDHANNIGGKSVWFKWTAPFSRMMYVTTNRSEGNFDTLINVYTGTSLSSLTSAASNHNINGNINRKSLARFIAVAGVTYYIAVDGWGASQVPAAEGTFVLDLNPGLQTEGADYDNDGMTDLAVFRPSNGSWNYIETSSGITRQKIWGTSGDVPLVGSIYGPGTLGFTVFRPSTNDWAFQPTFGTEAYFSWGASGDKPVPAQFGGIGNSSFSVYRPSTGEWFINNSQNNYFYYHFGTSEDIPVPGQYSPDDVADIAVFRPSDGNWYFMLRKSGNRNQDVFKGVHFGQMGDKPIPADFDGDGILDIAVYRPSNSFWYVLRSSDNQFQAFQWGIAEDIPTTGDYDGDGIFDYAVFRPSVSTWYIRRSSDNSVFSKQFGEMNDIPVTSNYGK
ncbi:MAG TPA: VCBS repeat-containing protein [Pyrinomonadaceae bacterium]|nr:VCBS repeat-containing protein [Pyrinomonadaceae bacterium]